ncbi:MAG: ABC transporter ATP-binding protein [Bacilli bacterium]|nr:ABC transporter ATP-binding protein [Bacilli bacterium]
MKKNKEKSNFWKNVKKTWQYIKDARINLIGYAFVSIIEAVIGAILPLVSAKIILSITDGVMNQLILTALSVFAIEFILYIMYYFKGFFYQRVYQKTLINLQTAVARETLNLEIKEIDKASSGMFIDRLNKDTGDISGMFMEYTYWLSYVISNVGVLVAVFILNRYLFIYAIFTSICIFLINKKRLSKQYEVQKNLKKIQEKKTGLTGELVRGIRDIKVLNASSSILKQTTDKIIESSNEEVKMLNIRRIYQYFENNLRSLSDLVFIIIGCFLYEKSLLTIPTFVIVYNYQSKIRNLLMGVVQISEFNKKFIVASDRIYEVIEDEKFAKERFGDLEIKKLNGHIEFCNVKFGYNANNKEIINNMSFEIEPNQKVAFVGKSGAGKTTIFSLITKLYSIDEGEILLDGYNINELTCNSLRDNMSIITQNPYIFNFSIKENLLLAKEDASMKEIRNACKMACIDDFIMSLPEKYETMVGENGVILSGGQKQRLAIARALLMKTEIILFDEATSALDNETQSEIQNAIDNLKGEYTILVVAHRLSTVIDCDKIFVVDEGKIIDSGSHKELLKKSEFYRNLYEKDLNV